MSYLMIFFNKALFFIEVTTHNNLIWNKKTYYGPF